LKLILTVVVLALGGLIAACGSSSSASKTTTSSTTASAAAGGAGSARNASRRAALAACLKQHGVTLPARPPGASGGLSPGSSGSTGTGTNGTGTAPRGGFFGGGGFANNPKLRAAFQACGARFGFGGGQRFRLSRTAITKYVTCVRQHGYDLPNPNLSGKGPVFPSNIRSNAKFQAASRPCQSLLTPPRSGTTTSTTSGA
jgi:hypothetical protein